MNKQKTNRRSSKRRSQKKKKQYRIRNWREYNAALVQRGSLTVWVDEAAVGGWHNIQKSGKRGASCTYSDSAIVCALTLQVVYHLPLRATEGLLLSLFGLIGVELPVPDFSTLSRRRKKLTSNKLTVNKLTVNKLAVKKLAVPLNQSQSQSQSVHLVVDSTGFKVYGEGEWKVRQHGWSKRRTWRKLHLGINEATGEILAAVGSGPERADKQVLEELLEQVEVAQVKLAQVSGDGAYDARECYGALSKRGARATLAPRRNARLHEQDARWQARNENLRRIRELQGRRRKDAEWGRKQWKQESGYHRRSLAETGMMRLKTIFGDKLGARDTTAQDHELLLRCLALNRMTQLGMPQSYAL